MSKRSAMSRQGRKSVATGGQTGLVVMLSLNLLLLAFFVFLNAIADFHEDRTRRVIDSVNLAFKNLIEPAHLGEEVEGGHDVNVALKDRAEALARQLQASLPAVVIERDERAGIYEFTVPATAVFSDATAYLRDGLEGMLSRFALVFGERTQPRLKLTVGCPLGAEVRPGRDSLAVRRCAVLVAALRRQGAPPQASPARLLPGRQDQVTFTLDLGLAGTRP